MIITKDFQVKLFLYLSLGFIIFTVIGTLSHELGHYIMARILGYDASLNYGYTFWSAPESGEFTRGNHDRDIIILAGPLQTIVTGTIGLILLVRRKNEYDLNSNLRTIQWLCIFLCLFWLREVFNFLMNFPGYFSQRCFVEMGDEETLALNHYLPAPTFLLPLAAIGSVILAYAYFRFIPFKQRLTFIVAGLVGGLLGFYLWMFKLGPALMP